MTRAKYANQTSKMEFGRDPSPPNGFRSTCEDKLEKKVTTAKPRKRSLEGSQTCRIDFGTIFQIKI